jgi:hypothetical protein
MTIRRIALAATIAALGSTAALTLGSGIAGAAPTAGTATETIARLQSQGNRVIVNKVGTGATDQCSVTSVRPVTSTPLPTGNPLTGVPNLQRQTIVHVGLTC